MLAGKDGYHRRQKGACKTIARALSAPSLGYSAFPALLSYLSVQH
jgi:hypothetical protein